MRSLVLIAAAAAGLKLFAAPPLPLSFDLAVHPEARGTSTEARFDWRWSERLASGLRLSFETGSSSGDLEGFGPGALYASSSYDGTVVVNPLVLSGRVLGLDWTASAGLGLKTERLRERGTYQSVGTQTYDNTVSGWRVGTPIGGGLAARIGPVSLGWDAVVWPASLYFLRQSQSSSLLVPRGELETLSAVGPEIDQDLRLSVLSRFWVGVHHEFLWLSVPRLVQNEAGDAWASATEGKTNQVLRVLGGVRLPIPSGALELGLGWKRISSDPDGGGGAELDEGLIFELTVSAGH